MFTSYHSHSKTTTTYGGIIDRNNLKTSKKKKKKKKKFPKLKNKEGTTMRKGEWGNWKTVLSRLTPQNSRLTNRRIITIAEVLSRSEGSEPNTQLPIPGILHQEDEPHFEGQQHLCTEELPGLRK